MEKPHLVIAAFKVKPGKTAEIIKLIEEKRNFLLQNGYVTERPNIICNSFSDENIVMEIFEWKSQEKIDEVHKDKRIYEYWNKFDELCEIVGLPLSRLPESDIPFATFNAVNNF